MAKQKYVKIVKGGVRLRLSTNAWVILRLACGYMVAVDDPDGCAEKILPLLPPLPATRKAIRAVRVGRKWTDVFKPSMIEPLIVVMEFAESIRAGCLDGPRTNIGSALNFLRALGPIELLAAAADEG